MSQKKRNEEQAPQPEPTDYDPDYATPPGTTLQETIGTLGMDQRELAVRTGLDKKTINQIIQGISPLTQSTAIRLERVTGVPARIWNRLEANYREQKTRLQEQQELAGDVSWLKEIPVSELIKRNAVAKKNGRVAQLHEVLRFFGVASVAAWNDIWLDQDRFAFRRSTAHVPKVGVMAAWLRLGEKAAARIEVQPFDKSRFRETLTRIRSLTTQGPSEFLPPLRKLAAGSGVAVVLIPEIRCAPASGATQWITSEKAMIQLSLRYKSNDQFWFSFFHEAAHILLDGKKERFVDVGDNKSKKELRADRFSATQLIPREREKDLVSLTTWEEIRSFAKSIHIAPGIVVGRLQHEGIIRLNQFNKLKVRFDWIKVDQSK